MSRTAVLCLLAPAVVGTGAFWLATHGYLVHAAVLLVAGVLALLAGSGRALNRGHRGWAAVLAATALGVVGAVAWYGWSLNAKLYDIQRTDDSVLQRGERPPRAAGESAEDLNILLLGADNPNRLVEKPTVAELLADGAWDAGAYRSDTLMVMHVPADRSAAYIVSIPRDSYVRIHDAAGSPQEMNKINAAFSDHGPFGTWRTVEGFTGLRLDHMAIIDFEGFRELTSAVGGVDVYIAETFYDPQQQLEWEPGWVHLEDERALQYVRTRYGLAEGDFDRVARQQNFLRAVLQKLVADATVGNPVTFSQTVDAITGSLTVDASWTNDDLRRLAVSLRGLDTDTVRFLTLPLDHYESVAVGSVNIVDARRARELWAAVREDRVDDYLQAHPEDGLEEPLEVR